MAGWLLAMLICRSFWESGIVWRRQVGECGGGVALEGIAFPRCTSGAPFAHWYRRRCVPYTGTMKSWIFDRLLFCAGFTSKRRPSSQTLAVCCRWYGRRTRTSPVPHFFKVIILPDCAIILCVLLQTKAMWWREIEAPTISPEDVSRHFSSIYSGENYRSIPLWRLYNNFQNSGTTAIPLFKREMFLSPLLAIIICS